MNARAWSFVVYFLLPLAGVACHSSRTPPIRESPAVDLAEQRRSLSEGADRRFQAAIYYKPAVPTADDPLKDLLPTDLMPLIVLESPAATDQAGTPPFRILAALDADMTTGPGAPILFAGIGTTAIEDREFLQITYLWRWMPPGAADGASQAPIREGIRFTLDGQGFPMLWEARSDGMRFRTLYASRRLEDAAAKVHGPPLPGRRFSIERSVDDAPFVVVPRVLNDAPTALGPFVYIAASGEISTLLCRCMASQADAFSATIEYRILPMNAWQDDDFDAIGGPGLMSAKNLTWQSALRLPPIAEIEPRSEAAQDEAPGQTGSP